MHSKVMTRSQVRLGALSGQRADRPLVLFVCVHNAGRSRIAEAFLDDLAGDRYEARSAGTQPADAPHPEVVASMAEVGLEVADTPGTRLTPEMVERAVRVVGMGCNVQEACPALTIPLEDWDLEDPAGRSREEVDAIRDRIEMKVRNLVGELDRELS